MNQEKTKDACLWVGVKKTKLILINHNQHIDLIVGLFIIIEVQQEAIIGNHIQKIGYVQLGT